jgi:hypothetical protein
MGQDREYCIMVQKYTNHVIDVKGSAEYKDKLQPSFII